MKRIIPMICAVLLMTLFVLNSSAQSFGTDESLIPYLDYTLSADDYTIHSPSIESSGGQFNSWVTGTTGRIDDVAVLAGDLTWGAIGEYTTAEAEIFFDFLDSTVDGEAYRPSLFEIQYSPFTIKYGDAIQYTNTATGSTTVRLDAYTLFDAIGANYEWYGASAAYVETEVIFRVYYVENQFADVVHDVLKYQPLAVDYRIDFQGDFTNAFTSSTLDVEGMSFYNLTDGVSMTFDQFHNDIVAKTGLMRTYHEQYDIRNIYLDVKSCYVRINSVNAPFAGLIQSYAPYISVEGYNYVNGTLFEPSESNIAYRQQYMSVLDALVTANMLNQDQLENLHFGEDASPIVRIPALFLAAVGEFFAIDFFGLGFTIGNLIGVLFLAVVTVIFLRLFAGG